MFGGFGMWEMLLIFLVVLLLFGAKRLPEIGSSLGKGIREFNSSLREIKGEISPDESESRKQSRRLREDGEEPRRLTATEAPKAEDREQTGG